MKLADRILNIFFPPKCVFCRRPLEEYGICPECEAKLPRCGKIHLRGEFFSSAAAPLYYEGAVRDAILRYKFRGKRAYAVSFSRLMAGCAAEHLAGLYDVITWVPVSRQRLRSRGFDQSELLARDTADILGVPVISALRKKRHTGANSKLEGREERAANVLGAFEAVNIDRFKSKRVLLVDDIYTTGATLSECSRMLLMAGAEDVVCLTLAAARRAGGRKDTP